MNGRTELLAYMGATVATVVGLFVLQFWYVSYLDVQVVHGDKSDLPLDSKLLSVREQEHSKLASAHIPIDVAKKTLADRGRQVDVKFAPKASEDLSAMAGWAYRHNFKPYEPRGSAAPNAAASNATTAESRSPVTAPGAVPAGGQTP